MVGRDGGDMAVTADGVAVDTHVCCLRGPTVAAHPLKYTSMFPLTHERLLVCGIGLPHSTLCPVRSDAPGIATGIADHVWTQAVYSKPDLNKRNEIF